MSDSVVAKFDLTLLVIATRNYIDYALQLLESANKNLLRDGTIQALVFTDNLEAFSHLHDGRIVVTPIQIPSYGWPNATLLRYHVFAENWKMVAGATVAYLDADTRIASSIVKSELDSRNWINQIGLVQHPGYYRRGQWIDVTLMSVAGPWESRRESAAYVPFLKRRRYVCGGVWFGSKDAIGEMVHDLRDQTQFDLDRGIEAKWHDESHLNSWAARNKCSKLEPMWAFVADYVHLNHLKPKIEVIHKPSGWRREH